MGFLELVYLLGVFVGTLMICYQFFHAVRTLPSIQSFFFLLLEAVKEVCKLAVWPVTLPIFILQLPFHEGLLKDVEDAMEESDE